MAFGLVGMFDGIVINSISIWLMIETITNRSLMALAPRTAGSIHHNNIKKENKGKNSRGAKALHQYLKKSKKTGPEPCN